MKNFKIKSTTGVQGNFYLIFRNLLPWTIYYLTRPHVVIIVLPPHVVAGVEGADLHIFIQVAPLAFDQVNGHPRRKDLMAGIVWAGQSNLMPQ